VQSASRLDWSVLVVARTLPRYACRLTSVGQSVRSLESTR